MNMLKRRHPPETNGPQEWEFPAHPNRRRRLHVPACALCWLRSGKLVSPEALKYEIRFQLVSGNIQWEHCFFSDSVGVVPAYHPLSTDCGFLEKTFRKEWKEKLFGTPEGLQATGMIDILNIGNMLLPFWFPIGLEDFGGRGGKSDKFIRV